MIRNATEKANIALWSCTEAGCEGLDRKQRMMYRLMNNVYRIVVQPRKLGNKNGSVIQWVSTVWFVIQRVLVGSFPVVRATRVVDRFVVAPERPDTVKVFRKLQ